MRSNINARSLRLVPLLLLAACNDGEGEPLGDDTGAAYGDDTQIGDDTGALEVRDCATSFTYDPQGNPPQAVFVAGSFNDWSDEAAPMSWDEDAGVWTATLELEPGSYSYKFVEKSGSVDWVCDPDARYMQCDEGYNTGEWRTCSPGASACNSMLIVEDCAPPALSVDALQIDRDGDAVDLQLGWASGASGAGVGEISVTLNGEPVDVDGWDGVGALELRLTGLTDGRYTIRVEASDADGVAAEPLYVPFWTDERAWETGLLYYVFVDRFYDGDSSLNGGEGVSDWAVDYQGGDWAGVIEKLDYLESLGVTALWLTAPMDNAAGPWGYDCGTQFTGYHGYWPSSAFEMEDHFGDEETLRRLIDEAHGRGMRVLVDWVANHLHEDHPYVSEHPEWFSDDPQLCNDANNWDDIPETCWFDTFLPDIRYYDRGPLEQMVDDAIWWVKEYELDGYRIDAVKHMAHPVVYNIQTRIRDEIEHRAAGGDEEFYTVGETFTTDRGLLGAYISDRQLDAQFDFPIYYSILNAFAYGGSLSDLEASLQESRSTFDGYLMSTFLGNHDVQRTLSVMADGNFSGDGKCDWDGSTPGPAGPAGWSTPYDMLKLAWTWLLTNEGLPLIYYGDEIGMPGYTDPDNRQMMRFDGDLSGDEAGVLAHVQALGQARLAHPQLAIGERTVWWEGDDVWAWTRAYEGRYALVVINRSGDSQVLSNALSWAGLPESGTWTDALTGETAEASGDALSFTVNGHSSRVWILE